jgi:hypothetical protein
MARGHRGAAAAVLGITGGAIAAAVWVGGSPAWAMGALGFYAAAAAVAWRWAGGSGDVAAILRVGGDERQRTMDREATARTGLVMTAVAVVGAVVEIARTGDPGVFGLFCAVAGAAYAVNLVVLRRRH